MPGDKALRIARETQQRESHDAASERCSKVRNLRSAAAGLDPVGNDAGIELEPAHAMAAKFVAGSPAERMRMAARATARQTLNRTEHAPSPKLAPALVTRALIP